MKTVYRSKFGWELFLPIAIVLVAVTALIMAQSDAWFGLAIVLLTFVFILHIFLNTSYTIENNTLTIICGFLYRKQLDIAGITRVKATNNILSSPATSLDRLTIFWGKHGKVMVSPKDKTGFIAHLQSINSGITYKK
jgi:hypothetical protein